jgi:hypothetical protein
MHFLLVLPPSLPLPRDVHSRILAPPSCGIAAAAAAAAADSPDVLPYPLLSRLSSFPLQLRLAVSGVAGTLHAHEEGKGRRRRKRGKRRRKRGRRKGGRGRPQAPDVHGCAWWWHW